MIIPLGAQRTLGDIWVKVLAALALLVLAIVILQGVFPLGVVLLVAGVLAVSVIFVGAMCMGCLDSAREALEYSRSSTSPEEPSHPEVL
ncbi:MAG: hypothetical protein ACFE8Z_09890 [Candidatus Hermodarchaeota archaeon]